MVGAHNDRLPRPRRLTLTHTHAHTHTHTHTCGALAARYLYKLHSIWRKRERRLLRKVGFGPAQRNLGWGCFVTPPVCALVHAGATELHAAAERFQAPNGPPTPVRTTTSTCTQTHAQTHAPSPTPTCRRIVFPRLRTRAPCAAQLQRGAAGGPMRLAQGRCQAPTQHLQWKETVLT